MLKSLVQVVMIIAMLFITWNQLLSDSQRQWVLVTTGLQKPVQLAAENLPTEPVATLTEPDSLAEGFHANVIPQRYNCLKPKTEIITEAPGNQIYSWVDNSGKKHFSDQPAVGYRSEDLSQQYAGETQYFNLLLQSPDGDVDPLLKERLQRDVVAIYRYLTEQLELDHLRKVTVSLKLFNEPDNYNAYQKLHAPNLHGSAGFYSAMANEAVVMRQRDAEITQRVARHEATHVIIAGLYGMTPIWLNEGLAEAFADYRNYALSRQFGWYPGRLAQLRKLYRADLLLTLEDLLNLNPQKWQQTDPAVAYPAAGALVRFMLDKAEARKVLLAILQRLARQPCAEIKAKLFIVEHFPGGMESFEQQWHVWLSQQFAAG